MTPNVDTADANLCIVDRVAVVELVGHPTHHGWLGLRLNVSLAAAKADGLFLVMDCPSSSAVGALEAAAKIAAFRTLSVCYVVNAIGPAALVASAAGVVIAHPTAKIASGGRVLLGEQAEAAGIVNAVCSSPNEILDLLNSYLSTRRNKQ